MMEKKKHISELFKVRSIDLQIIDHKNNFDHAEIYKWNNKTDFNRNLDKITSPRNPSLNPSYIRCKGPEV